MAASSSSDAATLLQRYNAVQEAKKSKEDAQAAQDALAQTIHSINDKGVLILHTVAEAKAFTCLLAEYFEEGKRLSPTKVEISREVGDDAWRKMRTMLESAGLTLIYELPK
ncbi:hypothetical protein ACJRO7_001819 [Eucalyptus globulus]|uniref:Uncharacterized protein n=1 Tax=Eucalyptus globulus TaxID=34317 RepID=A0ABD3LXD4_EUCGL